MNDIDPTTIALISQKLDRLLLDVANVRQEFCKVTDDHEDRLRTIEADSIRLQEQIKTGDRDTKILATVGSLAAAAVGRLQLP